MTFLLARPSGRRALALAGVALCAVLEPARAQTPQQVPVAVGVPVAVPVPVQVPPQMQMPQQMQMPGQPSPMPVQGGAPGGEVTDSHKLIAAPKLSATLVRKVIGSAALQVLLSREYGEASGSEGDWKTRDVPGVVMARYFLKTVDGARRTIEIAAIQGVAGGYEVHLYGRETRDGPGGGANPELFAVETEVRRLVESASSAPSGIAPAGPDPNAQAMGGMPGMQGMPGGMPGMPGMASPPVGSRAGLNTSAELGHTMFELSFTQSDRAIAMLKALGYSTIEFSPTSGDSQNERVYLPTTTTSGRELPLIVKVIDAPKTSLMDSPPAQPMGQMGAGMPMPQMQMGGGGYGGVGGSSKAVPELGGTFLHQQTAGEPQQRLLILYDRSDPGAMERLLEILREEIDVPARQVVISALVLEVNTDRSRDLGLQYQGGDGRSTFSFQTNPSTGLQNPLTYTFDKNIAVTPLQFSVTLKALIESGEAEVLSNPSVLVLDGRQARIQVGQQVPVVNSVLTSIQGTTSSVEYFPVGIVLNLRPRLSEDGSEVTMQVETIVSAISQTSVSTSSVFYAPVIDNRQVQSFVRVGDNTPFIIGGLISTSDTSKRSGIPFLSKIPILGALFRSESIARKKREVIVVLTPHVVPADDRSFSYVIPKDSQRFDSFGRLLFRNAYRIRSTDLFDLDFVHESKTLTDVVAKIRLKAEVDPSMKHREPFASLLAGQVPGEDILVKRMLWEIVRRSGYAAKIDPKQILVFQPTATDPTGTDFEISFLDAKLARMNAQNNALSLTFDAVNAGTAEHPFAQPRADVRYEHVTKDDYARRLVEANRRKPDGTAESWTILLSDQAPGTSKPLDTLRAVLVLKRVLALNASLPRTIRSFSVGRQIMFPTEEDIAKSIHVVDDTTARLFYEVTEYYRAFEQEFNRATKQVQQEIGKTR